MSETTMALSSFSIIELLFGLMILLTIIVGTVVALVAAVRHGHGAVAFILLGTMVVVPMLLVGLWGVSRVESRPSVPPSPPVATNPSQLRLASDLAKPVISLDEESTTEPADPDTDRPDWIEGDIADNQKVFESGPFATPERCHNDARKQLAQWVWQEARGSETRAPELWGVASTEVEGRFNEEQHLEKRETSVGEVYLLYTLGEIDQADRAWLEDRVDFWVKKAQREQGLATIGIGGGLLLGFVGVLHVILRSSGQKEKDSSTA